MAEIFRLSPEQADKARALGYHPYPCEECNGEGKSILEKGKQKNGQLERLCGKCKGTGRMWATNSEWEEYKQGVWNDKQIKRRLDNIGPQKIKYDHISDGRLSMTLPNMLQKPVADFLEEEFLKDKDNSIILGEPSSIGDSYTHIDFRKKMNKNIRKRKV